MNELCVLIADDSPSMRQMLTEALASEGYQTLAASDGQEAVERLQGGEEVHLALVDFHMPRLDGLGVVRALRALESTRFIPILMITTEVRPERREAARQAGATGWLVKPVVVADLLRLLQRLQPRVSP